jgi:serine/threonine protein kinase
MGSISSQESLQMVDYIGRQFGNYQLTRLLGEGAFAQVYLGEHIYLNTQAAIKILSTQSEDESMDRFREEARNIARLIHPNIVRVLEFGVESNTPFLVMDYAPNGTLRQHHPPGTVLPLPTIVSYIKQVAEALQYAHDEKLIHRDVKPENILLGRRNEVLLSDFGIALIAQTLHDRSVQNVAGTIPYMAPEQIQGQPRPASDQYSLGILVYEWLAGQLPFNGPLNEIVSQQLNAAPPSLRARTATISPEVEQVVMTALEKDPNRRFGSVRAFAVALEQASRFSLPSSAGRAVQPAMQSPIPPTAPIPPAPVSFVQAKPAGTIVSSYRGHSNAVRSLSWLPDSARIVSASSDQTVHIWDATTGRNLFQIYQDVSGGVRMMAASSDGLRIATVGEDGLVQVWDLATNTLIIKYRGHEGDTVNALAWSPEQYLIASAATEGTVHVWDATTGQLVAIYRGHTASVNALAWSPTPLSLSAGPGYYIVSGGEDASIQTWEASSGKRAALYRGQPAKVWCVDWSPNIYPLSPKPEYSSRVACGREDGMIQMWDTITDREVLQYRYPAPLPVMSWSSDGRRFAYAGDNKTIEVWDTMTNRKLVVFTSPTLLHVMAWSPDGKYIASGGEDATIQVWVAP